MERSEILTWLFEQNSSNATILAPPTSNKDFNLAPNLYCKQGGKDKIYQYSFS